MILVSGYNVFPREVEEALHAHADVREAAVVGRPDAYRGELPVAFVVPREGTSPGPDAIAEYLKSRLAPYKVPSEILIVNELPKTAVGKVDKLTLARRAKGQE
jgi:acyl-coenzyme A synthetase/AMP-(fatty) acid ligase